MPADRNAFKLGLTMILFFALLLGVLYFLAPRGGGDMTLRVRYPHNKLSTVLKPGGLVRCGGETVGTIVSLDLEEMKSEASGYPVLYSVVTFRIASALGLREDCRIEPVGPLLGEGGQLIVRERGVGDKVVEGQLLDGEPGANISDLMQTVSEQLDARDPESLLGLVRVQLDSGNPRSVIAKLLKSMDDVNQVTASISHEFDADQKEALVAKLHAIVDNISEATGLLRTQMDSRVDDALLAKVHASLDTLKSGLEDAVGLLRDNRKPINQSVVHVRNTTEILEHQIARRIADELDTANAASLLAKVHVTMDRMEATLADLNRITSASREIVAVNQGQIDRMLVNFKETSDHLKAAAKEIRLNPWRLLYQPTEDELAQANVLDAARAFSEAAARLDDAVLRLQSADAQAGQTGAAPDPQLIELQNYLQQTFSRFSQAEAALWEELDIR